MSFDRFVVLDAEMSDSDHKTICQLAIAEYKNGELISEWQSLINPQAKFGYYQTKIHGLTAEDVKDAPLFADIAHIAESYLENASVLVFGWNDFNGIKKNMRIPESDWIDVGLVLRKTWHLPKGKCGLKAVCEFLNISMDKHHDAMSDVKATAECVIKTMSERRLEMGDLKKLSLKPIRDNMFDF